MFAQIRFKDQRFAELPIHFFYFEGLKKYLGKFTTRLKYSQADLLLQPGEPIQKFGIDLDIKRNSYEPLKTWNDFAHLKRTKLDISQNVPQKVDVQFCSFVSLMKEQLNLCSGTKLSLGYIQICSFYNTGIFL